MSLTILAVVLVYLALTLGLGWLVVRDDQVVADDYFLAARRLPWYAVALSMAGSGFGGACLVAVVGGAYQIGVAPAAWYWGNFLAYTILVWCFLPYLFRKKLYTIPEFLEQRYGPRIRSLVALLWLLFLVLGVLAPTLYVGGRALYLLGLAPQNPPTGLAPGLVACVLVLAVATAAYCCYGGLLSVVWTGVFQAVVLVAGAGLLVVLGLGSSGPAEVIRANTGAETEVSRLSLLLPADHPSYPWPGVALLGLTLGMWYVALSQSCVQRCLGARTEWDAKLGALGGGLLKMLLPLLVIVPGLIAFAELGGPPKSAASAEAAYLELLNNLLQPLGFRGTLVGGLLLAGLLAAVMSTLGAALHAAATLWSIDCYRQMVGGSASEAALIRMGRISTLVLIAIAAAAAPLLVWWPSGVFDFVQQVAAVLAPPVSVVFLAALLWRRAHGRAAVFTLVFGVLLGVALWVGCEAPWLWPPPPPLASPLVQERIHQDMAIRGYLAADAVFQQRLQVLVAELAADPATRQRIAADADVQKQLRSDPVIQDRLAEALKDLCGRPAFRQRFAADPVFAERLSNDRAVREQLAFLLQGLVRDPAMRDKITQDAVFRSHLAEDPDVKRWLNEDALTQERVKADRIFRQRLAADAVVWARLVEDPAAAGQLTAVEFEQRLAADPVIRDHLAKQRLAGWLPGMGPEGIERCLAGIGYVRPLLSRAAVGWGLCAVLIFFATLLLPQDPHERYDPDTIWTPGWARLPAHEEQHGGGLRSPLLWWLLMAAATVAVFAIFR